MNVLEYQAIFMVSLKHGYIIIDVNYVNVNAFYFYFTPILVADRRKRQLLRIAVFLFPKGLIFYLSDVPRLLISTAPAHGCG